MIRWNYPDDSQMLAGVDIPIEGLGITMRCPKIKEILMLGEDTYFLAMSMFLFDKKQLAIDNPKVTNWIIFNKILNQKISGVFDNRTMFQNFLQLFFVDKVIIGPNSLIIQNKDRIVNIDPIDFENLQKMIKILSCASLFKSSEETYNPKNKRAAQIAEKMKKAHKRLAEAKKKENGGTKPGRGLIWTYLKFAMTASANSIEDVKNMTLFQLNIITNTGLAREEYYIYIFTKTISSIFGSNKKNEKGPQHWCFSDADDKKNENIGTI